MGSRSSKDGDIDSALKRLNKTSSALELPEDVQIRAAAVYRKISERINSNCTDCMVAASIYSACKQKGVPITLSEISSHLDVSRKEVRSTHKAISRELKLKYMPSSPSDYIPRFCTVLGLDGSVLRKAMEINAKAEEKGINSGKGSASMAAASIYLAAILETEKITQREVAEVAGITEVTIRNRYMDLADKLGDAAKIKSKL
ncbi:MAG: hypothetical protein ACOC5L_00250 [Halobacteriota archaeon]